MSPVRLFPRLSKCLAVVGAVHLGALACMPPPKSAEASRAETSELELARLRRENQDLELRLGALRSESDASKAALQRCMGREPAASGEPARAAGSRPDLPVVRLVPDPPSEGGDSSDSGDSRVVLRAAGDGEGEIAPAPSEPESAGTPPLDSGVRFSDSDPNAKNPTLVTPVAPSQVKSR